MAGRDAVAVDTVMSALMGHDPARVGYLHYCGRAGLGEADLTRVCVLGPPLDTLRRACRPSSTYLEQMGWTEASVERIFQFHACQ
jgi:hypothetical protein